jgi:hypothetical protein
MSISRTNILYMPVLKLNEIHELGNLSTNTPDSITQNFSSEFYQRKCIVGLEKERYVVAVDDFTRATLKGEGTGQSVCPSLRGMIDGCANG